MELSGHQDEMEEVQFLHWLETQKTECLYQEPILKEQAVNALNNLCYILEQNTEVFLTSADILEVYINNNNNKNKKISNCFLALSCCVLLANKLSSSSAQIKIAELQKAIFEKTSENVTLETIKEMELEVLVAVGRLPTSVLLTNVSMLLHYYITNDKVKEKLEPICHLILSSYYIIRYDLFFYLKSMYKKTPDAQVAFKTLICNTLYFPCAIVLCAMRTTVLKDMLDLKAITENLAFIANVHYDHVYLLSKMLQEAIEQLSNENDEV